MSGLVTIGQTYEVLTFTNGDRIVIAPSVTITGATIASGALARVTFSNADYTVTATTPTVIAQTGVMSAPRTVTLPAASSVPAGTEFVVVDESGTVSTTNTLTISRTGTDLINGAASFVLNSAYAGRSVFSTGSGWVIGTTSASTITGLAPVATSGSASDLTVGTVPQSRLQRVINILVTDPNATAAISLATGAAFFTIPAELTNLSITRVECSLTTASSSGSVAVALQRIRSGATVEVTNSRPTVAASALTSYGGSSSVTAGNAGVQTGDLLRVDITSQGANAKGLQVMVTI